MRALFLVGTALLFLDACAPKASPDSEKWVGSWATSPQLVEPHNMAPEPGLSNNTLRQIVRVSLGGDSIRLRFSNEFSNEAVRSEEHTSELQSRPHLVCRLLLEKK